MSNVLESQILEKRHHFIYGYDSDEREKQFKEIASNNPVVIDKNKPMVIYLDSIGIPKIKGVESIERDKMQLLSKEYFSFIVLDNILQEILKNVDIEKESARLEKFLNGLSRTDGYSTKSITDYAEAIKSSRNAYYEVIMKYLEKGIIDDFMSKLAIPFVMLEYVIKKYREMLNNREHFSVIADNKDNVSAWSQQAINNLVCSRINGDISMKVVTEPDKWKTYYAQNGQLAEYVHDYGAVELDSSLKDHVKKLKKDCNWND